MRFTVNLNCLQNTITDQVQTEVSLLRENRKVIFTKIAGGHVS
jgi:hypothetical protein